MTANTPATATAKDRVVIFDTTLRDGEQCPGATMTFDEKIEVADMLEAMGVDIIEAGFPIASDGDFEAVSAIAGRLKRAVVTGLSRAGQKDIDRAGEAVKHAARPRIHTFISTSPVHMKYKLQKSPEEVLGLVVRSVDEFITAAQGRFLEEPFYEYELGREVVRFGRWVHATSAYASSHTPSGPPFARGVNSYQLWYDQGRWWIMSILWDWEDGDVRIPAQLANP